MGSVNNEELASVVLLCTRAIIEVIVECTDGPSNMSGLRRDALGGDDETVS